ncbi:MAG: dephospho-CoA kinase [Fusobacteriaceae bacterium]
MILGLTGGIASGKSTASRILREMGYEVYDADIMAHEVLKNNLCKKAIENEFGKSVFDEKGEVNRKLLREIVFRDSRKLKKLNSIIHPLVIKEFQNIKENNILEKTIIFDIPLLFETNLEYLCDKIILIFTDRETQIKRIRERDKNSRELAEKMIDSQESIESKIMKSDYCIENSKNISDLKNEIISVLEKNHIESNNK